MPWGRLTVYTSGEGPPLLLLHGLGGSGRYWAGMAAPMAGRRRLIAPDLAGFGRSDKPRIAYTAELHLTTLETMLDALDAGARVDVAGHSMGGILAALFALRRPERVASLAVVASPFPRRQTRPWRIPGGGRGLAYRAVQRVLPLVAPLVRSSTFPRAVVADYLRHTVESYSETSNALIWDPALATELSRLGACMTGRPQLLLFSDEDRTIGEDDLGRWRAVLPDAEVRVMAGAHQLLLRDHFASLAEWYPIDAAVRD